MNKTWMGEKAILEPQIPLENLQLKQELRVIKNLGILGFKKKII